LYQSCRTLAADHTLLDFIHKRILLQPMTASRCACARLASVTSSTGCYDVNK